MASIKPTASGKWRAEVSVKYQRKVKTFRTKGEAQSWANMTELELEKSEAGVKNITFGSLLEKYRDEVSVRKSGERKERIRINAFIRDEPEICKTKLEALTKMQFTKFRDKRMKVVSGSTIIREMNMLSNVFTVAINEWGWIKVNPMSSIKRPQHAPPRDTLITQNQIDAVVHASGYADDEVPNTVIARTGAAFLFAIETAMREKEICGLRLSDVSGRVAKVKASKTRAGVRDVPLSTRALQIIENVKRVDIEGESIFNLKESQIVSHFRKIKALAGIDNIVFHDTRHLAITRLAKVFNVLELARIVGHKDLKMLMIYYNETAENLADKLD
ncbi:site-specific recombinase XerD [Methylovorus glucosotrophus]|uniref:tyrosine-type recombinase/integrase n=1 Tax=Methylovorus glucosotrophus TaxID=266009 RepID=UPI001331618D|nr:site-specific integrase [Methylovorus glucosotrophus]KAF0844374.1 site-specific recombinase XerD [Methylovorus glucosotrophus]